MNLKYLLLRLPVKNVSRFNSRRTPSWNYREICTARCVSPVFHLTDSSRTENCKTRMGILVSGRFVHSGVEASFVSTEEDENAITNEFLSRFVWIMRGKLNEAYADASKKDIDAMLQLIVGKVVTEMDEGRLGENIESASALASEDFSEDLWRTVWEVSHVVLEDMKKAKKKEKMKTYLQSEEVKEMTRFAGEIGIRGDLLRELRFKWAREKMEDSEFYESLERMRQESKELEVEEDTHEDMKPEEETETLEASESDIEGENVVSQGVSLPKRSGKIKFNIYGLDLSKPKWAEMAEQIHEAGAGIWQQELKPITGKCKIVTEKILSLQVDDDPSPLLAEWIELVQPSRVDWITLLDRLKEKNYQVYFKVAENLLDEVSFQADIGDFSQLVDAHVKHNQFTDAERIIKKMNEKGIVPDIITKTSMVHMYNKAGKLDLAKEAFESLKTQGFQPDLKVYNSMIMAYVSAGDHKKVELLLRELEQKSLKPSEDTFLALLKSFSEHGDATGAEKIVGRMVFAGYQPSLKSNTYLVEAYSRVGHTDKAREYFDDIIKLGYKPDDKCIARMIAAYAHKNLLDKGLQLLLQLEKDGIEHGVATYAVLIDWLCKLQLIDEAEDLLGKFGEKGVSPPLDVHISLCDMYARAREEKKALQALGVLEANKEKLRPYDFEKVISALLEGGFGQDAERMHKLMIDQGFKLSEQLTMSLQASQVVGHGRRLRK
uniref:pentatricopeptide repeat-containing protein At5g46580, chloroplastic n=1 Tax=Erigeron canadensis TaxID=72917 RepID=UPI001CB9A069|nr:pentatricopeptide repeat-containing protein At5g46580, chloroplastic [Erigeron canadensis]